MLCEPFSGRTHQIRLHLRQLGHPIANDSLYGHIAPERPKEEVPADDVLWLHAWSYSLEEPFVTSEAPRTKAVTNTMTNAVTNADHASTDIATDHASEARACNQVCVTSGALKPFHFVAPPPEWTVPFAPLPPCEPPCGISPTIIERQTKESKQAADPHCDTYELK